MPIRRRLRPLSLRSRTDCNAIPGSGAPIRVSFSPDRISFPHFSTLVLREQNIRARRPATHKLRPSLGPGVALSTSKAETGGMTANFSGSESFRRRQRKFVAPAIASVFEDSDLREHDWYRARSRPNYAPIALAVRSKPRTRGVMLSLIASQSASIPETRRIRAGLPA